LTCSERLIDDYDRVTELWKETEGNPGAQESDVAK